MSDGVPNLELPKAPEAPQEGADVDALAADRKTYEQSAEYEDAILHAEAGTELEAAQATHAHAVRPQAAQANAQSEKDEIVIEVEKNRGRKSQGCFVSFTCTGGTSKKKFNR